jgi:D-alanyl-D-alanine carboxypeptidase-like protein
MTATWRARTAAAAGLAAAMLLALGGCGGVPAPHGSPAVPAPGPAAAPSSSAAPSPSAAPPASPARSPAATPAGPAAPPSRPAAVFNSSVTALDPAVRRGMTGVSWRPGCPVPLASLRLLRLSYWGFDGQVHQGELVVNADAVRAVRTAFRGLFGARYPIHRMRLVEAYGGSDERSMLADNTSAFNCRGVPGSTAWSQHAYGRAVDLNPFENPEVRGTAVDPPAAAAWADRSRTAPAVIHHGDAAWQAFAAAGWTWGGDWSYPLDYQHFSANGL